MDEGETGPHLGSYGMISRSGGIDVGSRGRAIKRINEHFGRLPT